MTATLQIPPDTERLAPARHLPGVLARYDPPAGIRPAPVVFDSPHSGRIYPEDFRFAAPFETLRRTEDAFVDELYAAAPLHGASLLAALFPRSYVDVNRHEADIDFALLAGPWPGPAQPTSRSERGSGLIRRLVRPDLPVYDRRLDPAEVAARIERYHRPYHDELAAMLDRAHGRAGAVWHVNCHSMKAISRGSKARPRADFVLGDRDGVTCAADFTAMVRETLEGLGYDVRVNRPFKGVELVARHGAPAQGRHSLQIEVNRRLYMDEQRIEKTAGFAALAADLGRLIAAVTGWALAQAPGARRR